jgi:arginyl-tRNA synthetase
MMVSKKRIAEYLTQYISYISVEKIESLIEIPPSNINFSYAFPTFQLARHEKKAPEVIAKELKEKFKLPEFLDQVEAVGPYINFRINKKLILNNIFQLQNEYGRINEIENKKEFKPLRIVVEYPSPNTNKPLHLGHVRNMLIGNTVSNLLKYKGHTVFQGNLNNDRGIHICKSMLAYKKWFNEQKPIIKPDHFVGKTYVKYTNEEQDNEKLIEEAMELLKLWEQKDPETRALWRKMNDWALEGFKETYEKFGISFDKEYNESNFYWKGKEKI